MLEDEESLIGTTIGGKFSVEELLGRGSMGQVYRGRHLQLEQSVALKVMSRDLGAQDAFAARFEREARACFGLTHPNVIRVIDYGQDASGFAYIAMEYIDGGDLADLIRRSAPLPTLRVVQLMRQALAGLAAAHDSGVIHRDLKPENIMLAIATDDEGRKTDLVKVCDFGIAKLSDARADNDRTERNRRRLTETGLLIGTPEYMSPEQARGEKVDVRSDIYAMGVVLYELITGALPFSAPTAVDTVMKHLAEAPTPPSDVKPGVDPRLEKICLRALSKRPEDRYQSARQMRFALGEAVGLRESSESLPPLTPPRAQGALGEVGVGKGVPERGASTLVARVTAVPAPAVTPWARLAKSKLFLAWAAAAAVLVVASATTALRGSENIATPAPAVRSDVARETSLAPEATDPPAAARPPSTSAPPAPSSAPLRPSPDPVAVELVNAPAPVVTAAPRVATKGASTSLGSANGASGSAKALRASAVASPIESAATAAAPSPPVPSPPPEPAPAPAPAPVAVAPSPPPAVAAAPPPAPAFDPASGRAAIAGVSGLLGVRRSDVENSIARAVPRINVCYQSALRAASTPSSGLGTLHIETDDTGTVRSARVSAPVTSAGARCIERVVTGLRIPNVDTGEAQADVAIRFELH